MNESGDSPTVPLPPRPGDGHKGTFGTVLVIGGRDDSASCMVGGPAFAALGALRSGAGRAILAVPRSIEPACLSVTPSATGLPLPDDSTEAVARIREAMQDVQSVVIGPGLGTDAIARALVEAVVSEPDRPPIVLDADGLNVIVDLTTVVRESTAPIVVTPHPGEYERLADALELPRKPSTPQLRVEAAQSLSAALDVVTVLKGQGTVVADAARTWTCQRGTVALATAGTGDVLAGVIGSLLAQGGPDADRHGLAAWGVWIHAVAGEQWAQRHGEAGLLAAELAEELPSVLQAARQRG